MLSLKRAPVVTSHLGLGSLATESTMVTGKLHNGITQGFYEEKCVQSLTESFMKDLLKLNANESLSIVFSLNPQIKVRIIVVKTLLMTPIDECAGEGELTQLSICWLHSLPQCSSLSVGIRQSKVSFIKPRDIVLVK